MAQLITKENYITRKEAMNWWNKMSFEEKWYKIIKHKTHILGYPNRDPNSLTGKEIEFIHKIDNISK